MRRSLVMLAAAVLALGIWSMRREASDQVKPELTPGGRPSDTTAPAPVELRGSGSVQRASPSLEAQRSVPTAPSAAVGTTSELEGVVLDPRGSPVPGTEVIARYGSRFERFFRVMTTTSGERGHFSIDLPEGVTKVDLTCGKLEGQIEATCDSIGSEVAGVSVPRSDLVLRLAEPAFLRGVVLDDVGEPAPSLSIRALAYGGAVHSLPSVAGATDALGRFVLGPLRPGSWTLLALPQSDWTYSATTVIAPTEGITFRIVRALALRGHLIGQDTDGFEVLWILERGPEGVRQGAVKTDASGDFSISGLPDAPVRIYARRIGDARYALVEAARPATRKFEISLRLGEAIEGRCDGYDGRVIAHNGDLQHEGRAEGGTFRILGLPPGRWSLHRVIRGVAGSGGATYAIEFESGDETGAESGSTNVALR